ncbi:creatininase family protein [Paenibacillaceae bacterium WGS1546]|uniref:creatininase family protein n=1 Tax=Cohnella sp. WGS1546 TaxID=3366810 RepID=UPI00372D3D96
MTIKLGEMTWDDTERRIAEGAVAVVPVGAFEQHGKHMPLDTDWRLASRVAETSAAKASAHVPVVVLPAIWTGFSPHHMQFKGTVTLSLSTFQAMIGDVCRSLWEHGFRKILLLNGHGGNMAPLRSVAADLAFSDRVRVATASYWDFAVPDIQAWRESAPGGIDHACEMETSLMMHVDRSLVKDEQIKNALWHPKSGYLSGDLAIGGQVSVAFDFKEITEEGVAGDPTAATPERGEALFDVMTDRVAAFIRHFYEWDWARPDQI